MPFNVFISYARADEKFKAALVKHLNPLEKANKIKTWHDGLIKAGEKWFEEIKENLKICDVAIFLVSADFLASDFIEDVEIKMLLKREENGEVLIFPVLIKDCLFKNSKLSPFQALPRDLKPIKTPTNDQAWLQISKAINDWYQTWDQHKQIYFENIKKHYGKIRLLGHYEDTVLENIFTHLYMLDKLSSRRFYNFEELPQDHQQIRGWCVGEGKRQNGLELVKKQGFQRLYILGKPGAGKTTFLKYILLETVKGEINKIPIFISLKEWTDSKLNLNDFLIAQLQRFGFQKADVYLKHILNNSEALILFDGLDEVNEENKQRSTIIDGIKDFTNSYRQISCLMTCRIAATDYSFSNFKYVELADFTVQEMTQYVNKWFKNEPVKKERFLSEFEKAEHEGLKELGRVPLLLSLLCLGFNENMGFPARRSDLYEEALDALLRKWDISRNIKRDDIYRELSLKRKHQLFGRIAYENFEKSQYFFEQLRLAQQIEKYLGSILEEVKDLDGNTTLKAIECQHSIFVERAQRIYSFSHLTFQEYYTAKYIVDNEGTLEKSVQHCTEDRYREVLLLTASLLDNAGKFFKHFRLALDDIIKDDPKLVEYLKWAAEKASRVKTPYKIAAVRSFYSFTILIRALDFDRALARTLNLDRALDRVLKIDFLLSFTSQFATIFEMVDKTYYNRLKDKILSFTKYFNEVLQEVKKFDALILEQQLSTLKIPTEKSPQTAWNIFNKGLTKILDKQRHLKLNWDFNEKQLEKLETYFKANEFFIECLKLASVDKELREKLLDSLLLPPNSYTL
jgi:adenylate kinase family enzyme